MEPSRIAGKQRTVLLKTPKPQRREFIHKNGELVACSASIASGAATLWDLLVERIVCAAVVTVDICGSSHFVPRNDQWMDVYRVQRSASGRSPSDLPRTSISVQFVPFAFNYDMS